MSETIEHIYYANRHPGVWTIPLQDIISYFSLPILRVGSILRQRLSALRWWVVARCMYRIDGSWAGVYHIRVVARLEDALVQVVE